MMFTWTEKEPAKSRCAVHAIAVDDYGAIAGWHLRQPDKNICSLEGPLASCRWTLSIISDDEMSIEEEISGRKFYIKSQANGTWKLNK